MKLTFFLIALALVMLRLCYPTLEIWSNRNGRGHGSMVMRSDNYIQEIKWAGKVRFSDDEKSVAEISPGGYLKYRENDTTLKAESNLQGEISYSLFNGESKLAVDDSGRRFIAAQIKKMIRFGFLADDRAARIYKQGGVEALLTELSSVRMEGARGPFLDLIFKSDSLTAGQQIRMLQELDSAKNNTEEQHYLELFAERPISDSAVVQQWMVTVGRLEPSYMKKDLLLKFLDGGAYRTEGLPEDRFDSVLAITRHLESFEGKEVYERLAGLPKKTEGEWADLIRGTGALSEDYMKGEVMEKIASVMPRNDSAVTQQWLVCVGGIGESNLKKDLLLKYLNADTSVAAGFPGAYYDSVLAIASRLESYNGKEVFERLADIRGKTDADWANLVRAVGTLNEDFMKGELLMKIARDLPRNDSLILIYRTAAKSIHDDMEYGKTLRAVE